MPGMYTFNNSWLTNPSYEKWVEKNASDPRTAKCRACSKIIDFVNMGEAALKSHSTSKKHEFCDPQNYTPMLHRDYADDLKHFRAKSKSWAGEKGEKGARPGFRPLKF